MRILGKKGIFIIRIYWLEKQKLEYSVKLLK